MALEVSHHGYLLVTHLTTQEHCCHTSFHAYWYMNVMRSSRLCRVILFLKNGSILMIWGCFSIVSNVIRSNYCCRRHTMHGNMVFSRDSIFLLPHNKADVYLRAAPNVIIQTWWFSNTCVETFCSHLCSKGTLSLEWCSTSRPRVGENIFIQQQQNHTNCHAAILQLIDALYSILYV